MEPKRYIVWSKKTIDTDDPYQKKWYTKQVLCYGRSEDVSELDWNYIRENLEGLGLPKHIRGLWDIYFSAQ